MSNNDNTVHVGFDDLEFAALAKRRHDIETNLGVRVTLSAIVRGIICRELGVPSRPGPKRAKPRKPGARA